MEETEEDFLSRILNYVNPDNTAISRGGQPASNYYMESPVQQASSPEMEELKRNNLIYGDSTDFDPMTGRLDNGITPLSMDRPIQRNKFQIPSEPNQINALPSSFTKRTNVLAPFGTSATKSFNPMISIGRNVMPESGLNISEGNVQNEITNPSQIKQNDQIPVAQSQVQPISKQEQEAPKDNYFRESVGGILVALGAGFQGADASKALERYNSAIQNDKDEIRRQAIEQERKRKLDPSSQGNIAFKAMFEKYVPGVREMMGKNYDNMTEDMLRSSYPMIANGIKAATEKELSNPASESSIDAVKSYNQMISAFGGKIPPLAEGKISAKEVDRHMGKIDDFLRYNQNETTNKLNERKFAEDLRVNQQTQDLQNKKFGLQQKEFEQGKAEANRRANLQEREFAYRKQRDAEARKQAALLQQKNSAMSDKEARRIAEKYPYGVMLKDQESSELITKSNAYNKMKSALDNLEKGILQYGAPMNPMSEGSKQIDALWSTYMLAVKDAEEMGALDKGVEGAANRTLMNPSNMNFAQRISGGEKRVKEDTLSILKEKRDSYKQQYAKNTSNYGFNPELSAQENIRLMDEYINPDTSRERQQQIYLQNFKKLGYDPSLFTKYAENYETRRKILTGGY
jgi:hypothetical protein